MLARQEDNDKCQEPRVPFLATLKFNQMVQSSVLLCEKKKKKWEEGNEAWQANWKESRFLWTDRHTKCQGKKLIKVLTKRAPVATLLYYIYKLCRCTHSAGRKQGKHGITVPWNPSSPQITDRWRRLQIKPSTMTAMAQQSSSPV